MQKKAVVVAGNGLSYTQIDYSRLPENYDVFRVNNFHFEDKYYLGKKIKALFYYPERFFEQYYIAQKLINNGDYEIENIVYKMFHACDISRKKYKEKFDMFFVDVVDGYEAYFHKLKELNSMLDFEFIYNNNRIRMTTGIYAVACAVACGYEEIYIAGFDFLDKNRNYAFKQEEKLYANKDKTDSFLACHNHDTELMVLKFLQKHYQISLFSICPNSSINAHVSLAPIKRNMKDNFIKNRKENAIKDFPTPPQKAYKKFKRYFLEQNLVVKFLYDLVRLPSDLKHYFRKYL